MKECLFPCPAILKVYSAIIQHLHSIKSHRTFSAKELHGTTAVVNCATWLDRVMLSHFSICMHTVVIASDDLATRTLHRIAKDDMIKGNYDSD